MKIYILVLVMLTLKTYANSQFSVTEILNNNVTITVSPPYIVEGLTSQVDIVCTFKRDNVPSMASVMSMVIAHSNKTDLPVFNYLASANVFVGSAHNVSHYVEVISGSIDNNGESKLHMRFMYPETYLIGLYMCEVTGFDQIGTPVTIYSTLNVVTSKITDLFDALHNAQSNITELVNALHNAQSNLSAMQVCQGANNESIIQSTFCTNFYSPISYNGHVYYLSHMLNYFNYTEMQSKCEVLGGYLVELDSHDEFNYIRDYLVKLGDVVVVWTGATDENQEGVWINEHNLTARPTFDWGFKEPGGGRIQNCQCFHFFDYFFLATHSCYWTATAACQYMCEIPGIKC